MNENRTLEKETEDFFTAINDGDGLDLLERIRRQRQETTFKVCVAGEFSKGKTHLINSLLEEKILPESSIPTTTLLTEIACGEKALRYDRKKDQPGDALDWEELDRFSAEGDLADAEGILRVRYPASFLQPNLLLYDTPGVDDVLSRRADIAYATLESCDAALVTVSALAPLSLSEKSFLDTYLYARAIPRVAVVLTFLDQVPADDQVKQLSFVMDKVKSQYPDCEVWCALEMDLPDDVKCPVMGFAAMRSRLAAWQAQEDRHDFARRRDFLRLKRQVDVAVAKQRALMENLAGDAAARGKALSQAYAALDEENGVWRAINDDLVRRGDETLDALREQVDAIEQACLVAIEKEGAEAFAASMRLRLREAGSQMARWTQTRMDQDMQKTLEQMQAKLGIGALPIARPLAFHTHAGEDSLEPADREILPGGSESGLVQLLNTFGEVLTGRLIDMLPVPAAAKGPLKEAATKALELLKSWLDSNSRQKQQALKDIVASRCHQMRLGLGEMVRASYAALSQSLRREQRAWIEAQEAALREAHDVEAVKAAIATSKHFIAVGSELSDRLAAAAEVRS